MKRIPKAKTETKRSLKAGRATWFFIACGVYVLAAGIVLGPTLFSGQSLVLSKAGEDMTGQFLAWRDFGFSQLREGRLALWNPYLFCGAPFLGGFQSALLYPPNWLYLILPLPTAINVGIALHLVLAGIAMYCWVQHRRLHPVAPILAGLIFMFGGTYFLHIYPGHLTNLCTMVWAPLIFLSIDRLTSEPGWGGAWLGAAAVAMQLLAGHPQYVFYTGVIAGIYALLRLRRAPRRWHAVAGCLIIYLAGAALSAAQLLTGLQATQESVRRALSPQAAGSFSLAPENLLTLVVPHVFGDLSKVRFWGRWTLWEECIYVGVVAAALALFGLGRDTAPKRRGALGAAAVALVLALGYYTPLFHLLYHLPGFASFRGLSKFAFLFTMFVALLAALGFDRLMRTERLSALPILFAGASGGITLLLAGAINQSAGNPGGWWFGWITHLHWSLTDRGFPTAPPLSISAMFAHQAAGQLMWCGILLLAVAAIWWGGRRHRLVLYALPLLASIELVTFAIHNTVNFPMDQVDAVCSQWERLLAQGAPDARIFSSAQNLMLLVHGHDIWGTDPMVIGRYGQFVARSQGEPVEDLFMRPFMHLDSLMLRIARLQFFFDPHARLNRVPWPTLQRAQFISDYRIIPNAAERLDALADPTFNPARTVILETAPNITPSGDPAGDHVELIDQSTDQIEVKATVAHPSILLITDTYSTGWHIRPLEDHSPQEYEVLPADHAFRGIPLAAGEHHFLLDYRPIAWVIGKWISIVAITVYAILGAWTLTRPGRVASAKQDAAGQTAPRRIAANPSAGG